MAADLVFSNHGLRHSGGIERYLLTLVDALHNRGVRPTVVAHRFDRRLPEFGWVDAVGINTLGLGGALRDLWFDRQLRRMKRERGWYPLVALSQTAAADIAISGGTHPGFLAAVGSPGGSQILTYDAKTLVGLLDWGLTMQQAIDLPNVGGRGAEFYGEVGKLAPGVVEGLAERGIVVKGGRGEESGLHGVIVRGDGALEGGADPRREGQWVELPR